jgi:hypothetical protein
MIAALFVQTNGAYYGLPDVDPWDEARDARKYDGPHPVVAHPPCARWCALAPLVEQQGGRRVGDDDGCFASALASVRRFGGVLEHPAWSRAWPAFGLMQPPARGWLRMRSGEWVCEVAQSAYGHKAKKLTWLVYVGDVAPPLIIWSKPAGTHVVTTTRKNGRESPCPNKLPEMKKTERSATPPAFRDLLLEIARSARRGRE